MNKFKKIVSILCLSFMFMPFFVGFFHPLQFAAIANQSVVTGTPWDTSSNTVAQYKCNDNNPYFHL